MDENEKFDELKNVVEGKVRDVRSRVREGEITDRELKLAAVAVVSTYMALRYRKQLKAFKGKELLDVNKEMLEAIKGGNYGIYTVKGVPLVLTHLSSLKFEGLPTS